MGIGFVARILYPVQYSRPGGTWSHETGGIGTHKRSDCMYEGQTGLLYSVTAATYKTESACIEERRGGSTTRHIARPSAAYGKEESFGGLYIPTESLQEE